MTTWMIWLLLLMGATVALIAIAATIVLYKLQIAWMRAFGEQHGVNLSTESKPVTHEVVAVRKDDKPRFSIPLPGADMYRKSKSQ